jgi:nitroreductase
MKEMMMNERHSHRRMFLKSSAVLGSAALFHGLSSTNDAKGAATGTDIWDVFGKRRSVRNYKPDPVTEEDIRRIIDAARTAPTSGNQQPWKFLVVRDKDRVNRLKEACVKDAVERFYERVSETQTKGEFENACRQQLAGYFSAPVYIVVLTDNRSKYPDYNHWDGPLAAAHLMLAARALGYGTVHITDSIPDRVTKEVLGIPDHYTRVCITPLGVPAEWPDSPPKKELEEFIAYESL